MGAILRYSLLASLALLLNGCGSLPYSIANPTVTRPAADKALIVFMRPDRGGMARMLGSAGGADTYAMIYQDDQYIGQLLPKQQLAYELAPGKYTFMLSAFTADFMIAEVAAGRKYYVNVETIPMGVSVGFKFRPQNGALDQNKIDALHAVMKRVVPNAKGEEMARKDEGHRQKLKDKYYAQWQVNSDHAALNIEAGY